MEGEQLIVLQPENEVLKKHISFYYFHLNEHRGSSRKFTFYPNTINALTIYNHSKNQYFGSFSLSTPTETAELNYYYGGIRLQFSQAEIHAPFDKIAIAFTPLGINAFIDQPLSELISDTDDLSFNYFKDHANMDEALQPVFASRDFTERVRLLDRYFIQQLRVFSEPQLEQALAAIHDPENTKVTVMELAKRLGTSQKTLTRKFKRHLNCSPKKYMSIHQFRSALETYLVKGEHQKLAELVYEFDYSDQSNFIHQFKKISGINPKKLFQKVKQQGNGPLYWKDME